jgi:hypothetical protein
VTPTSCPTSFSNGGVSEALGRGVVVAESISVSLLDLDCCEVRLGREEGKVASVGRMGATSRDAGSGSSVYPGGGICCAVRTMAVRTGSEGGETAENGGGAPEGSAPCVTRGGKAAGVGWDSVD